MNKIRVMPVDIIDMHVAEGLRRQAEFDPESLEYKAMKYIVSFGEQLKKYTAVVELDSIIELHKRSDKYVKEIRDAFDADVLKIGIEKAMSKLYATGFADCEVLIKAEFEMKKMELCDKLGNPIDALDACIQRMTDSDEYINANDLIEKIKLIFHTYRQYEK